MSIHWSAPVWMWPLLLVVAAGAVLWTVNIYRRTQPVSPARVRRLLTALRGTVFVLLVLAVAAPTISRLGMRREAAELLVVVEDSASMNLDDAGPERRQRRWERALGLAAGLDSLVQAQGDAVTTTLLRGNGLDALAPLTAGGDPEAAGTDLGGLTAQALRRTTGRPVRAVVLVSDGQETRSGGAAAVARSGPGRPGVFVVGVGDPVGPADRLIADLRYPDTVHQGDEILVEILVDHRHAAGGEAVPLTVRLSGPDGVLADTTMSAGGGAIPLTLTVPAASEGLLVAELEVSPLDNERYLANNRASLAVDVRRDRARVLLIADRPGWDVRFLAQAAHSETRLALTVVHPTARGMVRADSLLPWVKPEGVEEWLDWDAVVVTGWRRQLAALDWPGLAAAVERGLGLLVLPGAGSPGAGEPGPPPRALAALLPVSVEVFAWRGGSFVVGAGASSGGHPVMSGVSEGVVHWPPLPMLVPASPVADAQVLLEAAGRVGAATPGTTALLVVERRGEGRTAWFGGQRLWELAFAEVARAADREAGEGAGRRLLRNLLVWAAAGDADVGLEFVGRNVVHAEGEPIVMAARWLDLRGRPVTGRAASVLVRRADADSLDQAVTSWALAPAAEGRLEARLSPLPPGRYNAALVGEGDPPVAGAQLAFVVTGQSVEQSQVRRDQRRLDLLAQGLDAVAVGDAEVGLPAALVAGLEALDWRPVASPRQRRLDLWSGWPFLVLTVGLLGLEWYLRRRHGLL